MLGGVARHAQTDHQLARCGRTRVGRRIDPEAARFDGELADPIALAHRGQRRVDPLEQRIKRRQQLRIVERRESGHATGWPQTRQAARHTGEDAVKVEWMNRARMQRGFDFRQAHPQCGQLPLDLCRVVALASTACRIQAARKEYALFSRAHRDAHDALAEWRFRRDERTRRHVLGKRDAPALLSQLHQR